MKRFYTSILIAGSVLLLWWAFTSRLPSPREQTISSHKLTELEWTMGKLADRELLALAAVLIGLSITGLARESKISKLRRIIEPGAPPNGGPATHPANSGAQGGPPSVS